MCRLPSKTCSKALISALQQSVIQNFGFHVGFQLQIWFRALEIVSEVSSDVMKLATTLKSECLVDEMEHPAGNYVIVYVIYHAEKIMWYIQTYFFRVKFCKASSYKKIKLMLCN